MSENKPINIDGGDLDTFLETGIYIGKDLRNAPTDEQFGIIIYKYIGNNFCDVRQDLIPSSRKTNFLRFLKGAHWGNWMFLNENGLLEEYKK